MSRKVYILGGSLFIYGNKVDLKLQETSGNEMLVAVRYTRGSERLSFSRVIQFHHKFEIAALSEELIGNGQSDVVITNTTYETIKNKTLILIEFNDSFNCPCKLGLLIKNTESNIQKDFEYLIRYGSISLLEDFILTEEAIQKEREEKERKQRLHEYEKEKEKLKKKYQIQ